MARLAEALARSDRPLIMAIVNRTRDSFYVSSADAQSALDTVDRAVEEGADLVDIGGVRAGAHGEQVSAAEEAQRVVPLIEQARHRHPRLVISVDTWRSAVAREACQAGADVLNDTWAGADPQLVDVAAEYGVGLVCSHTGGLAPRTDPHRVHYADVVSEVASELGQRAERAVSAGVAAENVLIDPTHDFGKNTWHSLALLRHVDALTATGWPVLLALSHKDFIGETLGVGIDDRLEGTLAATAVAAWLGARVFRAHDVQATRRALEMVATLRGDRPPHQVLRGLA